jgi:hypothetical protein
LGSDSKDVEGELDEIGRIGKFDKFGVHERWESESVMNVKNWDGEVKRKGRSALYANPLSFVTQRVFNYWIPNH